MTEKDEKFFEKKMDRREFLKKAGIGGAGLALGLSDASAFFAPKLGSQEKISYGNEKIAFYGKHQAEIRLSNYSRIGRIIVPSWLKGNWSKKMARMLSCLQAILVKQSGLTLIV